MTARVELSVKAVGPVFNSAEPTIRKAVTKALALTSRQGIAVIRPDTPIRTGLLRSGWHKKRMDWDEYQIRNEIFYSPYQERRARMAINNMGYITTQLEKNLGDLVSTALGKP